MGGVAPPKRHLGELKIFSFDLKSKPFSEFGFEFKVHEGIGEINFDGILFRLVKWGHTGCQLHGRTGETSIKTATVKNQAPGLVSFCNHGYRGYCIQLFPCGGFDVSGLQVFTYKTFHDGLASFTVIIFLY